MTHAEAEKKVLEVIGELDLTKATISLLASTYRLGYHDGYIAGKGFIPYDKMIEELTDRTVDAIKNSDDELR